MKNGEFWYDTDGNIIHAHGGWMLKLMITIIGTVRTETI